MYRFALALSLLAFVSCDSHDWEGPEGTKRLFQGHDSHDDHGADHKDGCHCSGDDHAEEKKKDAAH